MSVIKFQDDPIVAIATAPGRGGIGVVRVSGKDWPPKLIPPVRSTMKELLYILKDQTPTLVKTF